MFMVTLGGHFFYRELTLQKLLWRRDFMNFVVYEINLIILFVYLTEISTTFHKTNTLKRNKTITFNQNFAFQYIQQFLINVLLWKYCKLFEFSAKMHISTKRECWISIILCLYKVLNHLKYPDLRLRLSNP